MIIYEYAEKYDPDTGEAVGLKVDRKVRRCDFSGELAGDGTTDTPYVRYRMDYGSQDPCFGSGGDEYEFGRDFAVSMHRFLGDAPYEIKWSFSEKAAEEFKSSDFDWFGGYFRMIRIRAARRLLEAGEVKPWQLPGFEYEFEGTEEDWEREWERIKDER